MFEALKRSGRIVQVGKQQRSVLQVIRAREKVKNGKTVTVTKGHLTWNRNHPFRRPHDNLASKRLHWSCFMGNTPDRPFGAYRFRSWRWGSNFGIGMAIDLMVHHLDVVHWWFESEALAVATTTTAKVGGKRPIPFMSIG